MWHSFGSKKFVFQLKYVVKCFSERSDIYKSQETKKNFNFFLLLNIRDFEVPLHQKQNKCNFKKLVKKIAH